MPKVFFSSLKIFNKIILLSFLSFIFLSCGTNLVDAPEATPKPGSYLPLKLLQFLPSQNITAELRVYDSVDQEAHFTDLSVNVSTGHVEAPIFELRKGDRYAFVTIFYLNNVPFAAVYQVEEIVDESSDITFTPEQVMIRLSDLDPNYEGHVSLHHLPDFDLDKDQYVNYHELVEGSDPQNANSLPQPPEVTGSIANGQENIISIELTFSDASEIIRVAPVDPICGYHSWKLTPEPDSGGRIQKLNAEFNTRAYPGNDSVTLNIEAIDALGMKASYSYEVDFAKVDPLAPEYLGPEIAVIRPEAGATISDLVPAEAVACHETGVQSLVSNDANLGDEDNLPQFFKGQINTHFVGEGETVLTFEATDNNDHSRVYEHPVVILNEGEIKITEPVPGSEVRDILQVSAYVDTNLMPDLTGFYIDEVKDSQGGIDFQEIFHDVDDETHLFSSTQDLSFEEGERSITLVFKATTPTKTVTREVTYFINNNPDIRLGLKNDTLGNAPCIDKGTASLEWEVTNRNAADPIFLFKSLNGTSYTPIPGDFSNETGKGELEINCDEASHWKIEASRANVYHADQSLALQKVSLGGDLGEPYNNIIRIQPGEHDWTLQGVLEEQAWRVEVNRNNIFVDELTGIGPIVSSGFLQPRSYYTFKIELLNEEGEIVSVRNHSLNYLAQDLGLVLWYPLNESGGYGAEYLYLDTYELAGQETLSDFSAKLYGGVSIWTSQDYRGLLFDNIGKYGVSESEELHASATGLTLELLLKVDSIAQSAKYIFSKNGEFALGIVKQDDTHYKFLGTLGLENQSCVNNGFEGAGNWKYIETDNSFITNEWRHVVMTYNVDNGIKAELFVDGSSALQPVDLNFDLKTTCLYKHALNALVKKNGDITEEGKFRGILSEVAVYNRALSLDEIKASCHRLAPDICP